MRRRHHLRGIAALLFIPAMLFAALYGAGLRINWTPSYPLGLWRISPLSRPVHLGDHIFICPPGTETFRQALARGYLRRGLCPGWLSPLIKTVAALPGQRVDINYSVVIDGSELPDSTLQPLDGSGRALTSAAGGIVPPGMVFLHSPYRGSYDSRYFGPVPAAGVLGLAEPVVTVKP
ncbi:MAG: conjugative transfer signal peptidase TraF [Alphaproteobacteria bacterium]|nr:conjugative transfer signal peptidase TraF [Alphaproteobacteria bacterium]